MIKQKNLHERKLQVRPCKVSAQKASGPVRLVICLQAIEFYLKMDFDGHQGI